MVQPANRMDCGRISVALESRSMSRNSRPIPTCGITKRTTVSIFTFLFPCLSVPRTRAWTSKVQRAHTKHSPRERSEVPPSRDSRIPIPAFPRRLRKDSGSNTSGHAHQTVWCVCRRQKKRELRKSMDCCSSSYGRRISGLALFQ